MPISFFILEKSLFQDNELKEILEKKYSLNIYYFEPKENPKKKLLNFFGVQSLDSFWISWKTQCQSAASQLLEYIQSHQKTKLSFITSLSYESFSGYMDLDESTIRSLDLVYNIATNSGKIGTLFGVLDKTKTSMWKRFLREQILHPLQDIKEIRKRQKYIEVFITDKKLLDSVQDKLKYIADMDAILNRIALNRAWIKDMIQLKKSLQSIVEVVEIIKQSWNPLLKNIFSEEKK